LTTGGGITLLSPFPSNLIIEMVNQKLEEVKNQGGVK
jgi:hypothetical protein